MSNHNLFTRGRNGAVQSATTNEILEAARQVLAHRVRRGASLTSPRSIFEYLTMKLGALDYEVFGLVLADLCVAAIYVESLLDSAEIA
jgi:DNA repair protein RadC